MANFSNSFTGKGTGIELPQGSAVQAQQGLNQMILDAEKLRYSVYEKNRNEFLKSAAIDPIFVLSDSARKTQMGLISDFNKKWGKRAQETNYNLSEEDRQNMITDKNYITSVAQDQLATMDKYKQHRQLVEQHPDKFDAVEFAKATDNYMLTGHYDQTVPAWKPIDFGAYARDAAQKQEFVFDETKKSLGGGAWAIESYNMPDKTQGRFLVGLLGRNPQADADFFARWNKADKEKWFKLADENKDNSLSTEEEKNAIALWASEEFKDVRMSKQSASKGTSGSGAGTSGFNTKAAVGPSNNKNKDYDVQTYSTKMGTGRVDLPNTLIFPLETPKISTLTISKKYSVDANGNMTLTPLKNSETADFDIVGYNPDKDILIAKAVKDSDEFNEGETVLLDASTYDKQLTQKLKLWRGSLKATPTKSEQIDIGLE